MKAQYLFVIVLSLLLLQETNTSFYDLVLLPQTNGQACLDGSPPGIYVHEGSDENKDKFVIYFEGGGFCGDDSVAQTLQSCYRRSSTSLGTTTVYERQKNFDGHGILSTKQQENSVFHNWNQIYVIYCDGATHQGYRQQPISYKDKSLYFRGSRNSKGVFKYLDQKYDFYNQDTIVITGVSAGGIGTYQWTNYLHQNTKTSRVLSIPDSGMFIVDFYSPIIKESIVEKRTLNLMKVLGEQSPQQLPEPVQQCMTERQGDIIACSNTANYAKYIKTPMLIINSPYDQWSINNIIIAKCLINSSPPYSLARCNDTTRAIIEDYRSQALQLLNNMKNGRKNVGIWGPACVQHGFQTYVSYNSQEFKAPTANGIKLQQAIKDFLENPEEVAWNLDTQQWPGNSGCSGQRMNQLSQ